MSLSGKLRSLRRLSAEQRGVLIKSTLLIPIVRIQLRLFGLVATRRLWSLDTGSTSHLVANSSQRMRARSVAGAVTLASRQSPGGAHCLTRSLVLMRLLKGSGIPVRLRIGVTSPTVFKAHAWVEFADGEPLNDRIENLEGFEQIGRI